jgi:hypothetical protein
MQSLDKITFATTVTAFEGFRDRYITLPIANSLAASRLMHGTVFTAHNSYPRPFLLENRPEA